MFKKSKRHLADNNMGYLEHFVFASGHGLNCIKSGFLLIIHALIPGILSETGSRITNELNKVFADQNEYLSLKTRVEAFKKIVYHYQSKLADKN